VTAVAGRLTLVMSAAAAAATAAASSAAASRAAYAVGTAAQWALHTYSSQSPRTILFQFHIL